MMDTNKTKNVGDTERILSAVAGSTLVTWGLRRRSLGGLVVAVLGADLLYRGFTGHCNVYQWLGKNTADDEPTEIESAITIDKPADELYRMWREPANLSRIMGHFADVQAQGENRQHWKVHAPLGQEAEWESEITEERAGECLRWASVEGATLQNEGEISFVPAPQNHGTEVHLAMRFQPPGGVLGRAAIRALGPAPRLIAGHALRRFKSLAETGEIATLRHNPSARPGAGGAQEN